jgi:hypothetical protein
MCASGDNLMKYTILTLLTTLIALSCKNTGVGPELAKNLILNSTFQDHLLPSLKGWTVKDSSGLHFSKDIPSEGSGYSLDFSVPFTSIYTALTGLTGTHQYRLSVFAKSEDVLSGSVFMEIHYHDGSRRSIHYSSVGDTLWTLHSSKDTLEMNGLDTIFIYINGAGLARIPPASVYFNTCKFEQLD